MKKCLNATIFDDYWVLAPKWPLWRKVKNRAMLWILPSFLIKVTFRLCNFKNSTKERQTLLSSALYFVHTYRNINLEKRINLFFPYKLESTRITILKFTCHFFQECDKNTFIFHKYKRVIFIKIFQIKRSLCISYMKHLVQWIIIMENHVCFNRLESKIKTNWTLLSIITF